MAGESDRALIGAWRGVTAPYSRRHVLSLGGAAIASGTTTPARAQAPAIEPDWIPFSFENDFIELDATINGSPARMLLDTGVVNTSLTRTAAERFGVQATDQTMNAEGVTGDASIGLSGPFRLGLGVNTLDVASAGLVDFPSVSQSGLRLDGIIGCNLIERFMVDIDFVRSRLAFRSSINIDGMFSVIALKPAGEKLRSIDIAFGEREPVEAMIDLGATTPMIMSKAYADSTGIFTDARTSTDMSWGVEGIYVHGVASAPRVRIGPATWRDVPCNIVERWNGDQPVIVGAPIFAQFGRVVLVFQRNEIVVVPRTTPPPPFPRDRSGLAMDRAGEIWRVDHVGAGSPAAEAGWREGDEVVAVNGTPMAAVTTRGLGMAPAGTQITFTMADGSTRVLTLADYY